MYRCDNCGLIFEEPKTDRQNMGECWGTAAYDDFAVCPDCLETDFKEVKQCDICGRLFEPHQLAAGVCEECDAAEAV